jgi:sugar phosphate isomerase/epimerase
MRDEHVGLEDGTLDWRHVLDTLDLSGVSKIVIEVRALEMVEATRRVLVQYLEEALGMEAKVAVGAGF